MAAALDLDTSPDAGPPAPRRRRWPALAAAALLGATAGWGAASATAGPPERPLTGDRLVLVVTSGTLGRMLSTYERDGVLTATLVNAGSDAVTVTAVAAGGDEHGAAAVLPAGGTTDLQFPVTVTCDPQRPRVAAAPPQFRVTAAAADGAVRTVLPRVTGSEVWGDLRGECRRQAIGDAQTGDGTVS